MNTAVRRTLVATITLGEWLVTLIVNVIEAVAYLVKGALMIAAWLALVAAILFIGYIFLMAFIKFAAWALT